MALVTAAPATVVLPLVAVSVVTLPELALNTALPPTVAVPRTGTGEGGRPAGERQATHGVCVAQVQRGRVADGRDAQGCRAETVVTPPLWLKP